MILPQGDSVEPFTNHITPSLNSEKEWMQERSTYENGQKEYIIIVGLIKVVVFFI